MFDGVPLRDLGITRQEAWKSMRLAEIPEDQFEALLKSALKRLGTERGRRSTLDGILREGPVNSALTARDPLNEPATKPWNICASL